METMLFLLVGVSVIGGGGVAYFLKKKYQNKKEETQTLNIEDVKAYTSFV